MSLVTKKSFWKKYVGFVFWYSPFNENFYKTSTSPNIALRDGKSNF